MTLRCSYCAVEIPDDEGELVNGEYFCSYTCTEDARIADEAW